MERHKGGQLAAGKKRSDVSCRGKKTRPLSCAGTYDLLESEDGQSCRRDVSSLAFLVSRRGWENMTVFLFPAFCDPPSPFVLHIVSQGVTILSRVDHVISAESDP